MMNTKHNKKEDMTDELQSLKGKTKLKHHQDISNFYEQMKYFRQSGNFDFEEDLFSKMLKTKL